MDLIVNSEARDNTGEPPHTIDLTDQAIEATETYKDQIAELIFANYRHPWRVWGLVIVSHSI